eukprot:936306-Amphidinium_carterae.2
MVGPSTSSAASCASPGRAPMKEKHSGKQTMSQPRAFALQQATHRAEWWELPLLKEEYDKYE